MVNEFVLRSPQLGMAGGRPPAGPIDQGLGMFDPEPHGEGLAIHRHAEAMEHGEGVAGAVAHRQDHPISGNPVTIRQDQPLHGPGSGMELQALHPSPEAHLPPQRLDPAAQSAHHRRELKGADMGPVQGENLGRGAGGHQFLEDLADECLRLTHLAVKLAIGEGAGPSLPELDIRLRIEGTLAPPEAEGVGRALLHRLAPFEQEGPQPHLGQQESGEVTAGSSPHHHGTGAGRGLLQPGHEAITIVRNWTQVGVPLEAAQQTPQRGLIEI